MSITTSDTNYQNWTKSLEVIWLLDLYKVMKERTGMLCDSHKNLKSWGPNLLNKFHVSI